MCVPASQIMIEHPEAEEHGDYSTNIALELKGGPPLAEKIAAQIGSEDFDVSVAGSGFINFKFRPQFLVDQLDDIAIPQIGKGKTVVVEYSSPNIAKPFGIGHLSSTIIGQALYNIYQSLGYQVIGDNHLGDWGTQFGKIIYMIKSTNTSDYSIENLEKLYVQFHKLAEADPSLEEEGRRWFKKLEDKDPQARQIWQMCVDVSLAEFDRVYELLGVKIDNAYGESFYEDMMVQVIADARDITKKSQGALIIEVANEKTPLMLLKSDGGTTYATRDLATVKFRKQKWDPDLVIYEVGAEQTLHFRQVFAAAKLLGYVSYVNSLIHTKHGLYLDTDGKKFATRKGKTVKLEAVLNEAIDRAKKLGSENDATAKAVGIGAIKYFNLMHGIQSDVVFDWEKIMALEGNSGPYLQYTYARTQSVLAKSQIPNPKSQINFKFQTSNFKLNREELAILRWIYRYGEVVEEAAARYAPNLVCNFLYELAQRYNTFYNKHPILGNDFRLALTQAVGSVLKSGLNLLGIAVLEHM